MSREAALRAADAQARRVAQSEFVRPLVLEAGAGTGKTATLVARVLAWTLGPGWERAEAALPHGDPGSQRGQRVAARTLDRVVAITFTEAAAAEMAQRVDRALAELQAGSTPVGVDLAALPASPLREARAAALRGVLDHLQVQTIHAWCRRLLAAHPLAARVHPTFQVDADGRLRQAAARRVLTRRLRAAYAGSEAGALLLASRGVGPAELEAALLGLQEHGVRAQELSEDLSSAERLAALLARVRGTLAELRDAGAAALARLSSKKGVELAAALAQSLSALPEHATPDSLRQLAAQLALLWNASLLERLDDWSGGHFNQGEKKAFGAVCDEIARASGALAPVLRHVVRLDLALLEAARPLLAELLGEVEGALRRAGVLDFGDLLAGAACLLAEHPGVAAAVRGEMDQLLVDEFQDTDRRQCAIVGAVALDASPGERPGLFLVGDPKQSIYGWREADLAAYEAFVSRALAAGGASYRLCVNHRSVRCVLDEVERVIAPVMQPAPGLQPAFEPLIPRAEAAVGEPVEYWLPARLEAESGALAKTSASDAILLEAQALARRVDALHREGVAWSQMALLCRSRSDWDVYLEALRSHAVPYSVEGDRHYYRRREIVEAAAWVRCVLDPDDVVALVAALRSSAVGVPDAAWIGLFAAGLPGRVAALGGTEEAQRLAGLAREAEAVAASLGDDVPGIERVHGWQQSLLAALAAIGRLRRLFAEGEPDAFVEALRDALHFEASEAARFLGAWRVANLERFFHDLSAALCEGSSPAEVLRSLRRAGAEEEPSERAQPRDLEAEGVRVMTLHGAKGLDFQHVFLLQLHKGSATRSDPVLEVGRVDDRLELCLHGAPTPGFDRVAALRQRVVDAERVRLLYVGMTRARDRLVLSGLPPALQSQRRNDTHAALLESRQPTAPDWSAVHAACVASASSAHAADGARWRILALEAAEPARTAPRLGREPVDFDRLRAEVERLHADAARAAARSLLPRGVPASRGDRDDDAEPDEETLPASHAEGERPAERARLVGSAVHRVLENLDLDAELDLERLGEALSGQAPLATPQDRQAAEGSARALLTRFARGALGARLRALRGHVVARELPVLLPPGASEPATGFVAGAIDLVYRDPESGELVVVDYKTDHLGPQGLPPDRLAAYARQGAVYQRALCEALDLERAPRFELWLLDADRCEVVRPVAPPPERSP